MKSATSNAVGAAYISYLREEIGRARDKILHCLRQLSEEDLHWRPRTEQNDVQTLIVHSCGSFRQWVTSGVGGAPNIRNRPAEFAKREPLSEEQLVELLSRTIAEGDAALAQPDPALLLERRRIQGFDTTILEALFSATAHLIGHAFQIVYATRLRLGGKYQPYWVPTTPEQIAAGGPGV